MNKGPHTPLHPQAQCTLQSCKPLQEDNIMGTKKPRTSPFLDKFHVKMASFEQESAKLGAEPQKSPNPSKLHLDIPEICICDWILVQSECSSVCPATSELQLVSRILRTWNRQAISMCQNSTVQFKSLSPGRNASVCARN